MDNRRLIYSNASKYQVSDADCERLALAAMTAGIERILVLPSSLPVVNAVRSKTLKAVVAVSYPSGAYDKDTKIHEICDLVESHEKFDELYAVLAVGRYISGYVRECAEEMDAMIKAAKGHPIFFVIEAGMMNKEQKTQVVELAVEKGASGIVSSTDFVPYDIDLPDVSDIADLANAADGRLLIVANGQISHRETCNAMLQAGADYVCSTLAYEIGRLSH